MFKSETNCVYDNNDITSYQFKLVAIKVFTCLENYTEKELLGFTPNSLPIQHRDKRL